MASILDGLSFGGGDGQPGLLDSLPPWLREQFGLSQQPQAGPGMQMPIPMPQPNPYAPQQPQQQPPMPGTPMPRPSPFAPPQGMPQQAPQMPPGGLPPRTPFGQAPKVDGMGNRLYEALGGFLGNDGLIGGGAAAIKTLATGDITNPYALAKRQQLETYAALQRDFGVPEPRARAAMQNPEVMKALIPTLVPKYQSQEHGQLYGRYNEATGRFDTQGAYPKSEKLDAGQNLVYTTPPVGDQPATSVPAASGGPDKPPQNYTWNDPNNPAKGATRIPGTEPPMSKDEASMVSMLQASRMGVKLAKDYFLAPEFKGTALDAAGKVITSATGTGDISRHTRAVRMGAETALRMATGAAAPSSEVKTYADFYTPSVYDSVATRQQKLDALGRLMDYAERNMSSGRLVPPHQMPRPEAFMQGGSAAGPVKDQSRVNPGAWPALPPGFVMMGQ